MNKLWVRLSLTFSAVVLLAVLIVVISSLAVEQFNDDREQFIAKSLQRPGGLVSQLASYYQAQQGWSDVETMLVGAQALNFRDDFAFALADAQETIIYHPQAELIGRSLNQIETARILPIQVDRHTVGFLELTPVAARPANNSGLTFLMRRIVDFLLIMAAVMGVGGIVFGIVMSRSLTAPLNNLAAAAKAIGARNLSRRVEEKGSDELIAVARSFNEMAEAIEQAEQLRRNLLADVAHELRTPLSILQGNLRAILDEVYPLDQTEMARLYEHTRSLSRLVNDLHELAQAEARQLPLHQQDTDLAQLARTTIEGFRPGADEKGVAFDANLPPSAPTVPVDPGRLTQVLQNLLANALRHTPSGGTITLCLEAKLEAIHLAVTDTGDGIPAEHLPHIFDRFYRTDPARSRDQGGAGLGLAIARAIVEAHGGQIAVTSPGTPGAGSTFTIRLPFKRFLFTGPGS